MTDEIYEKLADAVNARTGYPCKKCPELYAILEYLYTPEEAEFAVALPMSLDTAEGIARAVGSPPDRPITKDEARRILAEAEEAGLVHCSTNTSEMINFICNCCSCHCGIMESIKLSGSPNAAADSSFITQLDADACIGCGECIERCQVETLTLDGDTVALNTERCLGCGLCISTCPAEALKLVPREGAPVPHATLPELTMAMIMSYQEQKKRKEA